MRAALVRAGAAPGEARTLLLFLLLVSGLFSGDSFWVAALALAAGTVVLSLGLLGRMSLAAVGVPLAASLLGLAAWSGASVAWSVTPDRSWDELNRGLVYVAFAVLGVAAG